NLIAQSRSQEPSHILRSRTEIHVPEKALERFVCMEQMKEQFLHGPVKGTKGRDLVMKQVSCLHRIIERVVDLVDLQFIILDQGMIGPGREEQGGEIQRIDIRYPWASTF